MKVYSILFILISSLGVDAQISFKNTYGGMVQDRGRSIQQTWDEGYIITGSTSSFGNGLTDVYLLKIDSLGLYKWSKTFGGNDIDWGMDVKQTTDSGFAIAGYTMSTGYGGYDMYLIKTDSIGDTLWTKTYGGTDWDIGNHVEQTSDLGYIIVGETYSFGAGNKDVYLVKTNSDGDTLWTKTYGGSSDDGGKCVKEAIGGGYIILGYTESYGAGGKDVYLIRTDANGDTTWTRTYGWSGFDEGNDFFQTSIDSGIVFIGTSDDTAGFGGMQDMMFHKVDQNGDSLWLQFFGGPDNDEGNAIAERNDGSIIIAGSTYSFGAGPPDFMIYKTNAGGAFQCSMTYGSSKPEMCWSIDTTSDAGMVMVGSTSSWGQGFNDIFVIKADTICKANNSPATEFGDPLTDGEIQSINTGNIIIYPNPFSETTNFYIPAGLMRNTLALRLYNLLGEQVYLSAIKEQTHQIRRDGLSSGVYLYQIQSNEGNTYSGKLIIN